MVDQRAMSTRVLRSTPFLIIVLGVVAAIVYAVIVAAGNLVTVSSEGDWPDYYELDRLVEDSHLIVVARFVGQERERVEIPSPVMENSGVFRDDVLREYEAEEILMGSLSPTDTFLVWNTEGIDDYGGMHGQEFSLAPVIEGELYVLFLRSSEREGEPIWGRTGEPEKALVKGNTLSFIASNRYVEVAKVHGYEFPEDGSRAPFEVSLDELRSLVQENPSP